MPGAKLINLNENLAMTKELLLFFCITFVFPVFSRASQCTKEDMIISSSPSYPSRAAAQPPDAANKAGCRTQNGAAVIEEEFF
jgi:hypothetical protein